MNCGMQMKPLKIPMYTPIRSFDTALASIRYGIDMMEPQAKPTKLMPAR